MWLSTGLGSFGFLSIYTKTYIFNPSNNSVKPKIISDRNYQDTYSDPGNFVTKRNEFGRNQDYDIFRFIDSPGYSFNEGYEAYSKKIVEYIKSKVKKLLKVTSFNIEEY